MNSSSPNTSFNKDTSHSADHKAGLRHTTIRQILNAVHIENRFEIDGQEVGFVLVIANVYDVNYRGGKLEFGLDDGTGRIKAYLWDVEGEDAKRELTEHELQSFSYVQTIGKISEFRGIHSIHLTKKHFVKDPHEIYHHLLSVMAESILLRRGPPDYPLVRSLATQEPAASQPPETLSLHPLQKDLPDTGKNTVQLPGLLSQRSASSEDLPRVPDQSLKAVPRLQTPPPPTFVIPTFDETPHERNYSVEDGFSPMAYEPASPLPSSTRLQQPWHQPAPPERLLRASIGSTTPSAATVTEYQASPQFVSPKISPPLTATVTEYQASPQFVSPKTSPPRPDYEHHGFESPDLGNATTALPEDTKPSSKLYRTKKPVSQRRDPYSHLSMLQRDIILTVQNAQNISTTTGDTWRGVSVMMLVQTIARRRHDLTEHELEDAFTFLLEEGYIHTTIDDSHFACT